MRKAFTLIELLVVIAIIAVLAIVVVLTLNPGQLILQARDSSRLSDLANFQTAMNLYVTDAAINGAVSLGPSSVTYVSVPDPTATTTAGTDCSGLGFPSGGSFHCAASSTYRKTDGTGWIPVNLARMTTGAALGSWPVDPQNSVSSGTGFYWSYATDGTTWKAAAVPESQKYVSQSVSFTAGTNPNLLGGFPNQGWVTVPGNGTFGTQTFSVMKYDAVCVKNGVALTTPTDGTGYRDNNSAADNCKPANGLAPASLPNAIPIVDVSQTSAASYCANIGAHLMTNNEWQTIVWNAQNVGSNWNGGVVGGTGANAMYSGHNDNSPGHASVASGDDTQGYSGTDGPSSGGGTGSNATQRRTLTLSNGSVVWDMGGNVWQWTNDTIMGASKPVGSGGAGAWSEWTTVTYAGSTLTAQTAGPAQNWSSSNGIGQYYEGGNTGGPYGFLRGGGWSSGSTAGVGTLYLDNGPTVASAGIGFRCAR